MDGFSLRYQQNNTLSHDATLLEQMHPLDLVDSSHLYGANENFCEEKETLCEESMSFDNLESDDETLVVNLTE